MKKENSIEDNECLICCDEKATDNLHCYKCNKVICISCCNKLNTRTSLLYVESKHVFIKYCCPFCRYCNNKHIKYNNDLVNNYNYIYSENKRLQEDINNKNSQIAELVKDKVDEVN